jgi:acetyl-CoA carboxylase biotin carboxyl carrier protein
VSLTARDVEAIMRLLDASRFDRLKLEMDGLKLELSRGGGAVSPAADPTPPPPPPALPAAVPEPAPAIAPGASAVVREGLVEVKSPLLGIFYRAPKPGEPPFVEVGSRVDAETVIGIVEVMKLMNTARAGVTGEVVEILAPNGELIEHGQVLMLVRPEA